MIELELDAGFFAQVEKVHVEGALAVPSLDTVEVDNLGNHVYLCAEKIDREFLTGGHIRLFEIDADEFAERTRFHRCHVNRGVGERDATRPIEFLQDRYVLTIAREVQRRYEA